MSEKTEARTLGLRDGVRLSVTWLHNRAAEMTDPHARAVLNSAAFHLGQDGHAIADGKPTEPTP